MDELLPTKIRYFLTLSTRIAPIRLKKNYFKVRNNEKLLGAEGFSLLSLLAMLHNELQHHP